MWCSINKLLQSIKELSKWNKCTRFGSYLRAKQGTSSCESGEFLFLFLFSVKRKLEVGNFAIQRIKSKKLEKKKKTIAIGALEGENIKILVISCHYRGLSLSYHNLGHKVTTSSFLNLERILIQENMLFFLYINRYG